MSTFILNPQTAKVQVKWHTIDADGQILGRFATKIAVILRGKDKSNFTPHVDCGDYVIVLNAEKIQTTAEKGSDKLYRRHSGYMGSLKTKTLSEIMVSDPRKVIYHAVAGMLPKNRLRASMLKKLKIYIGMEHRHEAQQPKILKK